LKNTSVLIQFKKISLLGWRAAYESALFFFMCVLIPANAIELAQRKPANNLSNSQHQKLQQWCYQLTPRLPSISKQACMQSKLISTGTSSVNNVLIMNREFKADSRRKKAVRVLLLGGIHGDEQTASSIIFKWIEMMHKTGAQEFNWKVVPVLNPDGLLAKKPSRVNANGVDLNRNFPTPNWEVEATQYWIQKTKSDPRRYPGKFPISEPESLWVYRAMMEYKPHVIISVHAPFGVLDLDGPANPPTQFGRLLFNRVGVYPGSLGNYSGIHQNIPVLTIELPNALTMSSDHDVIRIWQDMQGWIRNNLPVEYQN
jgi:protein MpaA